MPVAEARVSVAVSTAVFGVRPDPHGVPRLCVALVPRMREPFLDRWALPGAWLGADEELVGLSFAVFDAVHALAQPLPERVALVEASMPKPHGGARVHHAPWQRCESRKDILARYQDAISAGQEGLIVIPAHGMGYKLKRYEQERQCVEVEGWDRNGQRVALRVDPATARIVQTTFK